MSSTPASTAPHAAAPAVPPAAAIPVRRMAFPDPAQRPFHPLYIGGNSALSYMHSAMGLYAEQVEPFLVKAYRRVLDRVRDPVLAEAMDRFCRQESQHCQQHKDFNRVVLAQGYPGVAERVARLAADFERYLTAHDDRFRIGFAVGFESYTTQGALHALRVGWYDNEFTLQPWGDLFKWHMLEELEHRAVTEDLWDHLYGQRAYRAWMCLRVQRHMRSFFHDVARLMSAAGQPRFGPKCRITPKAWAFIHLGPWAILARTLAPGYSVHALEIPAHVGVLSRHYSRQAESVR